MDRIEHEALMAGIDDLIQTAKGLAEEAPSRELSLTITKLEEAQMWGMRIVRP